MPKFTSVRFGELEYREEDLVRLPEGLIGMPQLRRWLILDMGDDLPMKWLQSVERGDFGFPVTQPELFRDDYEVQIPRSVKLRLENRELENLAVLVITTVHEGGSRVTGNLMAPLVLDTETRLGAQVARDDDLYTVREEMDYFKFGLAVKSESSDNELPAGAGACGDGGRDETRREAEAVDAVV
ncbi:MAG: flagellar assembly protein FliW [Candidatus Krumholzibacteriia bacterium]